MITRKSPGAETFFVTSASPDSSRSVRQSDRVANRPILDDDGRLLFGKHKGESAVDLAKTRMGRQYLLWVLDNVECVNEDDQVIIEALIDRYS